MATIKQLHANRLNALKSTGPRTEEGKLKSRMNAVRHGLTAETVVHALEDAADYEAFEQTIAADYSATSATEQQLVARLASLLWRLRRSTRIETGLLQIQAELLKGRSKVRGSLRPPQWYDELDVAPSPGVNTLVGEEKGDSVADSNPAKEIAYCFLHVTRLQLGVFDTFTRYEAALWREVLQLMFTLRAIIRR